MPFRGGEDIRIPTPHDERMTRYFEANITLNMRWEA